MREAKSAQEGSVLTEAQVAALEKAEDRQGTHGECESESPGYCGAQERSLGRTPVFALNAIGVSEAPASTLSSLRAGIC